MEERTRRVFLKRTLLALFLAVGCADLRPAAQKNGHPIASDSMARGQVHASAIKTNENSEVCFDISLKMSGVSQAQVTPRNWSVAWIDAKNQYHLLTLNQRDPASIPQGGQVFPKNGERQDWTNTFRTCAPKARLDEVKGIVLTPKDLPFEEKRALRLNWE